MRRWWVSLALLLSLGVNLGLVAAVAAGRWADRRQAAAAPPAVALPAGGRELPGGRSVEVPDARAGRRGRAVAGPDGRHRPHGPGEPPLGRLADHLGLAGAPRDHFVALQREFIGSHLAARRERTRLGSELRRELVAPQPDPERIEDLLSRLGASYVASERATAAVILESRELLDDDQREAYFRFLERLRHGAPGDGPHDGPGGGGRRRHR